MQCVHSPEDCEKEDSDAEPPQAGGQLQVFQHHRADQGAHYPACRVEGGRSLLQEVLRCGD